MKVIQSIYLPVRRYFFLEDDEAFHSSDIAILIAMPVITVASLTICFMTIIGN